ncbi:signal recognition particle [Theileria orientalis strain Shintoku]|uniref:Signal recognition particle n=1 Tax=Theileria orientalis strain Shintoku TaxID=869250 RepID=J7MBZ2_THEOR|nr:signal recognition particle [Theileria orientalis strain Shintoku]BAM38682.1 signal recognition particle [Theileria orientalis strain Shintoku]|eukprot:XP_009688983.1 signal recognition particle [Theileria orientalis strain Shintoku]
MNSDTDHSNWNIIYPTYLDKDSTTSQGRKVNLSIAVSKPTLEEIKSVLEHLNVPHILEPRKRYPRNWLVPGRVRVFLGDHSVYLSHNARLEKQLLNEVATLISQLKTRQTSISSSKSSTDKGSGGSTSSKKKPGKKKR